MLVAFGSACTVRRTFKSSPGPYDRIDTLAKNSLRIARERIATGDLERAHALLDEIASENPLHVPTATLLQELQLTELERAGETADEARLELANSTFLLAQSGEAVVPWILHARLLDDPKEAQESLDRAAAYDPDCVWVAYARAWWAYRDRDFKTARERVNEAFDLDGGHLETLRLYARLMAGGSEASLAIDALTAWISRSADNSRVTEHDVSVAEVDLAALYVMEGEPDLALEVLTVLNVDVFSDVERAHAELVRAAAFDDAELGRLALRAANRAQEFDAANLLPFVHRAMLLEPTDKAASEAAWKELLQLAEAQRLAAGAEEDRGFLPLMLELRARFEVARAEAARARAEEAANNTTQ